MEKLDRIIFIWVGILIGLIICAVALPKNSSIFIFLINIVIVGGFTKVLIGLAENFNKVEVEEFS